MQLATHTPHPVQESDTSSTGRHISLHLARSNDLAWISKPDNFAMFGKVVHLHLHLSSNHRGRWGTTGNFTVSSIFFCSPLPSGTWRTPGLSIPPISSSHLFFRLPSLLPSLTMPYKRVLARPDERETCPYHFSLRLFTIVTGSSCGPIACWILARYLSWEAWCGWHTRTLNWLVLIFSTTCVWFHAIV